MSVLDGENTWSLIRPGHQSSTRSGQLIRRWGLIRESVLGQHIGDEEVLMGRHFWVGCGCFSWGVGEGRESARSWSAESVAGRHTSTHVCCSDFDNPSTCSTHEDSQGTVAPRSTTDSTDQWVSWLCTYGLCCFMLYVYYKYMSVICCYMLYVCYRLYVCYMSSVRGGS